MPTYILPGMGADATMYGSACRRISGVIYLDWPKYAGETTVAEVARAVVGQHGIGSNDVVGGSSLGGIVAAEISAQVDVRGLVLVGSTLTPERINPVLKQLSALSDITPLDLFRAMADKAASIHESRLLGMFGRSNTQFVRAMCKAVFAWPGNPKPDCDVAQIHGGRDRVIHPPPPPATLLADAGHLIAMTHETEVADFIGSCLMAGD